MMVAISSSPSFIGSSPVISQSIQTRCFLLFRIAMSRRILKSETLRRSVFLAALLVLHCSASDSACEKSALGIEGGAKEGDGVVIAEVLPRGPADVAGIRRGDVLVSIGGRDVRYACQVPALVFSRDC